MCRTTPEKEVEIGGYSLNRGNIWPVAEYLPLKQGLKPAWVWTHTFHLLSCRVPSTKIRIETWHVDSGLIVYTMVAKYLPLKQGLKHECVFRFVFCAFIIAEYLPLKQGLKREVGLQGVGSDINCRVPSTKTRIETPSTQPRTMPVAMTLRVPSTKTRIETVRFVQVTQSST